MIGNRSHAAPHVWGKGLHAVILLGLVLLAAACSSYEKLPQQTLDGEYKIMSVISGKSGSMNIFFVKPFEVDGLVAMCGGYTRGESSFAKQAARNWADVSNIRLDGTEIGNASFMNEMPIYGVRESVEYSDFIEALLEQAPTTNCVRTKVPWKPEYAGAEIERTGPNTIRVFD